MELPKMDEEVVDRDAEIEDLEEEEDLPKLTGAPIEKMSKVNVAKGNQRNSQSTFLSKLYK
jgi:hypothetical protein